MARVNVTGANEIAGRWLVAAAELEGLLQESDALLEQRASLRRRRAELFRELVEQARVFVDAVNAPPREQ